MNLQLHRYSDNGNSTQGILHEVVNNNPVFLNYTLEDEHRNIKISGETCIPEGLYEVKERKVDSPMTAKYRERYSWFHWHLELQDVPDFKYVYIHIGNHEGDTNGCILVADNANNNMITRGFNSQSTAAFKRLYLNIIDALDNADKIFLRVRDIKDMF